MLTSPMLSEGNLEANLSIGFQFILCDGGKMKRERERESISGEWFILTLK